MPNENAIGERLIELSAKAERLLLLAAPFIKRAVVERIIEAVRPEVEISCYTRWRPEEVAAGVSDLDVWTLLRERGRASLWLVANLHAKYYRSDDECMVGSANLTSSALGWVPLPNLELLVSVPVSGLAAFETALRAEAVEADAVTYQMMLEAATAIGSQTLAQTIWSDRVSGDTGGHAQRMSAVSYGSWTPCVRHPADVYAAYRGDAATLSEAARDAAIDDLLVLAPPAGLSSSTFQVFIAAMLLQHPLVREIDHAAAKPQRFGAVRDLIAANARNAAARDNPSEVWQTLMRWLLYFLPQRYALSTPNYSEIFERRDP